MVGDGAVSVVDEVVVAVAGVPADAHDEEGKAALGDKVRIVETAPISKTKCWKLEEVLSH